ncbi:MAG TPA: MFS transporter [Actinomycetota bacterium]|nr:MFS transporter [Actinomycetota bacterium]
MAGIGLASFLSDLGHEVPTALLPAFLVRTLGAPAAALGLVEGAADALAGAAKLLGGGLADDPRRRRATAVGSYATTAVLSGLIGLAGAPWQVGVLRGGAWAARGLRSPSRNALLAEAAPQAASGRAYGFERAMDNLGAISGPLLGIGLVAALGVRGAILASTIPGLLAAAAIFDAARHVPARPDPPARPSAFPRPRVRAVFRGTLGRAMAAMAAFELGNVAATLLILRASELLSPSRGERAASAFALALYTAYNLAATLASLPAGRLVDRRGPRAALGLGVGLFLLSYLGFAAGGAGALLPGAAFVLAGLGIGCVETAEHAAVARLTPDELRGSAFGVLGAVQSVGNLVASGTTGLLWSALSPGVAFLWPVAWMAASLALLGAGGRWSSTP